MGRAALRGSGRVCLLCRGIDDLYCFFGGEIFCREDFMHLDRVGKGSGFESDEVKPCQVGLRSARL